ncbi:MAG: CDP-diacylglycerol--serine O-phosphatidyltransferase, partial [Alistipes sp.]|nr:CDP-diacylglycerol--serine O-phosphatidyltransferase [Alistipes sp.]
MKIRLFTLPNMLTLANLVCGAAAIIFALQYHDYTTAFLLIVASAVFDFCDGFAARLLHSSSAIGVELDSLADDISFGLAPALILYDAYIDTQSYYALDAEVMYALRFGVLIIAAFAALRLARFNIDDTQHTEFRGLPTPAATLLCSSLAVLFQQGHIMLYQEQILVIAVAVALLLVSPIRMFALKFSNFSLRDNTLRYAFILVSLLLIIFCTTYAVT